MCIIAAKPMGVKMPPQSTIEEMWFNNPNGAGFMYAHNGTVHIEKGFMTLKDFNAGLDKVRQTINLDDTAVVLHFRIATHGGVIPANTHPFPVSSSMGMLQKLKCTTSLGVAHNGIIDIKPRKNVSDTMEYVATQLAPLYKGAPKFYKNPHLMEMVSNAVQSKLALLNTNGEIYTVGQFTEDDGILYSNTSYLPYKFYGKYWDSKWDDYYTNDYDYGTADEEGIEYTFVGNKRLRWFTYTDYPPICVDATGRILDSYELDIAVDDDGRVYEYVYSIDGFVEIEGARAYDDKGYVLYATEDSEEVTIEAIFKPLTGGEKVVVMK